MNATSSFHPAVAAWFARTFPAPTAAQSEAWPVIQAGRDVLVAAATGSGKTLAAFLAAIDQLVREGAEAPLPDETRVVYVSPLKALSNDIRRNLMVPIEGIRLELAALQLPDVAIRAVVRSGDTPQSERASMRRKPPHILVTTPESLYVLLGSASGRQMLSTCRTVIVDEIHALVGNKRGSHLALSLERLQTLTSRRVVRIGLSATQTPIGDVARFLVGARNGTGECAIVDSGHVRDRDLALEVPTSPLEAVMSGEVWMQVYDRLAELVREHRTTLIFVNTRRLAERVARHLSERIGQAFVAAHHGSLAKERRLDAEQRLKQGELKALVATASLELGIDIGNVDLVCQLGSTRSINALLQRVGRAGHAVGGISKGRLFPLSRDDLVECAALLDAVRCGELDQLSMPIEPLDVLSQHLAAEVSAGEWHEDALFDLVRAAHPYRSLLRGDFDECIEMLAQGFSTRRGRHGALLHHDAVNKRVRPRNGARLTAITCGGAIPDNADYKVVLEPEGFSVGTVNEDFAVESLQGDVFQLGNTSYKILRVERGTVRVEDARGQPPSIPFWLGEAPGRTDELSAAVSRLRTEVSADRLAHIGLAPAAATQLLDYLAAGKAALGALPSFDTVIFERFFDESGGMQLVIHSTFGSRVNRAWGLALRKRFCRTFNFELQAAATEDHIVLSLTHAHSFELVEAARYLHSNTAREVLVQALCAAPMFGVRWRWAAGIALALPRFRSGKKIPPQIVRMNAEDLLASIFPDQVACAENLPGELAVPDHPLVRQTVRDCLQDAMDVDGFERVLRGIESGAIRIVARDLTEPSPLALEALNARPYAYLDDAPLEERRTQAVISRRWIDAASAADIGKLDADAIARVRAEAWPDAATADQLCDALSWLTYLTAAEVSAERAWPELIESLVGQARVVCVMAADGRVFWIPAERRSAFEPVLPASDAVLVDILRGRLEGLGPVGESTLADSLGLPRSTIAIALAVLQAEGFALRGNFTGEGEEWCERRLLARIHRYTVKRLRAEIEPASSRDYLRFLFDWQRMLPAARMRGSDAVAAILAQLEGFEAPAGAWETEIIASRMADYEPEWLDEHCRAGRFVWSRLSAGARDSQRNAAPLRSTPIALLVRRNSAVWMGLATGPDPTRLGSRPRAVLDYLSQSGASFFDDIADGVRMLPVELEDALAELVGFGLVNSDSFGGLRALLAPNSRRGKAGVRRRRHDSLFGMADAGRWAIVRRHSDATSGRPDEDQVEHVVRTLLRRWGVIFWRLIAREAPWLPSWRDLLLCCRRLEARDEIRGGRFIAGFSGEQFAAPEAVGLLRDVRRRPLSRQDVVVCGADPLNLLGIVTPGARLPSIAANRCLFRDGLPVATLTAGEVAFLEPLTQQEQSEARSLILRHRVVGAPAAA